MTWLSSQCLPEGWIQSQDVTFVLVIKYVADSRADTYSTKVQLLSSLRIQEKHVIVAENRHLVVIKRPALIHALIFTL